MALERLQKIIAHTGIASRRKAESLIVQGKVTVNGKVVKLLGTCADPECDTIKISGKLIAKKPPILYYLGYKPRRMLTTLSDPRGRPTVRDMLRRNKIHFPVYPVGRLDWDAEGLLLFTNDGALAHKIMHPRGHITKQYLVKVKGHPEERNLVRLRQGIELGLGIKTLPARVMVKKRLRTSTWLKIDLIEGRKHQIKRMLERIRCPVLSIKRVRIGPLSIRGLKPGQVRALTERELKQLRIHLP